MPFYIPPITNFHLYISPNMISIFFSSSLENQTQLTRRNTKEISTQMTSQGNKGKVKKIETVRFLVGITKMFMKKENSTKNQSNDPQNPFSPADRRVGGKNLKNRKFFSSNSLAW